LVAGGYTPPLKNFDALVVGYYDGPNLIYAARTRNGFTPAWRAELFREIKPLVIADCPLANLLEKSSSRCAKTRRHRTCGAKAKRRDRFLIVLGNSDMALSLAKSATTVRPPDLGAFPKYAAGFSERQYVGRLDVQLARSRSAGAPT
jgi:hypothetical protein